MASQQGGELMDTATAPTQAPLYTSTSLRSTTRLQRVKELWIADKANREEIGRLLYEERSEWSISYDTHEHAVLPFRCGSLLLNQCKSVAKRKYCDREVTTTLAGRGNLDGNNGWRPTPDKWRTI